MMRTRFEIEIQRRAARFLACLLDREHFRMFYTVVGVETFAQNFTFSIDDYRTYMRIRRGEAETFLRQLECAAKEDEVGLVRYRQMKRLHAARWIGVRRIIIHWLF